MVASVQLYDTTLRDGTQGEGINFSLNDKLRLAKRLAAFGIHYIEGGWPGSNEKDIEFFEAAKKLSWGKTRIAAFGSTRKSGVAVNDDLQVRLLLQAETPTVTFFGKSWLLHVHEVLRTSPEENRKMISDTVAFLKTHGREVIYDAEHFFDGYIDNPSYALSTIVAAAEAGADRVVLCDTNGGRLPHEITRIVTEILSKLRCPVGIHTHNDCELGVSNAIAAVQAGATQVQGTINGYGERTGNCNLTSVIPLLELKLGHKVLPKGNLGDLTTISRLVDELANLQPNIRAPFVGASSFAHKGGMHVNAVKKVSSSFEHIDPSLIGNHQRILVGELSGRTNVVLKARELGIVLDEKSPETKAILQEIKRRENLGFEYEAADASLELLIRQHLAPHPPAFDLTEYHVSVRKNMTHGFDSCEATLKVKLNGEMVATVADGDGPVNALDGALRKALLTRHPQLKNMQLVDYKVRIINSTEGTAAKTRVWILSSDGHRHWATVGVSFNIIEASWIALADSVEYFFLHSKGKK